MPQPRPNEAVEEYYRVMEMIGGLCQMWAVTHSRDLLCMPDGRTRLLWNREWEPERPLVTLE